MKDKLKALLQKQHYKIAGDHSGVKICTWTKKSIKDQDVCYKQTFYGIKSHLCCQCSVSVGYCQNMCVFCWREMDHTYGTEMKTFDMPQDIYDGLIKGQRLLLSGLGGYAGSNKDKLKEAHEPMHFAISLTGDALIYPKLNEFVKLLHSKGKSTFIVTNGMLPDKVKTLEMPTQLYISVDAPNAELFNKIDRPLFEDGWDRLQKTLKIVKGLNNKTRTTLRFTLIKGMNMEDVEGWAKQIEISQPLFVEAKAYMFVGSSRQRLSIENMPRHKEVKEFAQQIAKETGYKFIDEKENSRVVLLAKEDFEGRIMEF
ncbi:4-demethylwyosine synthase TYW1 [Candidatus Woesearchaeota archaeon]|nr:4-demethylwyosine synthase TYW1 [Candidatus Woesearchaeota archaeon]